MKKHQVISLFVMVIAVSLTSARAGKPMGGHGTTTTSQPVDSLPSDTILSIIQDPELKAKTASLLADHRDLLPQLNKTNLDDLLKRGKIRNLKQKSSTPTFEAAGERSGKDQGIMVD